jgi:hypothetical protein
MPLSDIVNVQITRQTQSVSEQGFGTPMILGTHNNFTDLIRDYSDMDGVSKDFASDQKEYIAAQDIFAQDIHPQKIFIGRRPMNDMGIEVISPMPNQVYTLTINGTPITVDTTSSDVFSIVQLNSDLVEDNLIQVEVNDNKIGTITSIIDFDAAFVNNDSIVATVNGVDLAPIVHISPATQADTMQDLLDAIKLQPSVDAASSVSDTQQLTIKFTVPGNNTVDSVEVTNGSTTTAAQIAEGGFIFMPGDTMESIMEDIADEIELDAVIGADIESALVSGGTFRTLTVRGIDGTSAIVNQFLVTKGSSQALATITTPPVPMEAEEVAALIVAEINSQTDPEFPVSAIDNGDGTISIINDFPGESYSLKVSTNISRPSNARVMVTQVIPGGLYTVSVNGIEAVYEAPVDVTSDEQVAAGLVALIDDMDDLTFYATDNEDGTFDVTSFSPSDGFAISATPELMSVIVGMLITQSAPINNVAIDLNNINEANSDWYALLLIDRTVQVVKDASAWIESRNKIFGTASSDPIIINSSVGETTSIAAQLNQLGRIRTFVMYHQDADNDYPEAAWMGRVLPLEPGSETWKFKSLRNVTTSKLTTFQSSNALNKNANTYEYVAGVGITGNGTMAEGEYIDIIRGIDWMKARMQEYIFGVLVRNDKVPYTDAGIASIQAEVMRVLQVGIGNNFIAADPAPTTSVPRAAEVPVNDKAQRILKNVKFHATLSGAIHAVEVRGTVSLN